MIEPIEIIASHDDFILINKPAGLDFHQNETQDSLIDLVRAQTGLAELYTVHRLDKMTSGLLLLARSSESARYFSTLFAEHRIQKYYLALSDKKPSKKQGKIRGGMEKGRNGSWKLVREGGQLAITQFFSYGLGNGERLFLLKPLTGRTHQLRVAMKSLGSPIIGDERYAGRPADRGYLHAYAIAFDFYGNTHQYICTKLSGSHFQSTALATQLETLSSPWQLDWPQP
ncbi:TIGR01621 family pseudouridine synthase [Chitinibacter bivalviorum]|uniref:TIGR01621 family pseudouridine synthase n=1 Tax=Chitinibacter bivalviorum TaxID=2739434 RepID=A0A7H9BFL8_9NEIS|nr:TIGR01621 family pseudouridine synthase [Chitinibacter bivalviorum]QLG86988.1 TIGR01621 family pseudouridine synthase [Chitinibacter bivalviorum]